MTRAEFALAAEGLPARAAVDLEDEVVHVEPADAAYFSNDERQRCIVRSRAGELFVSFYD